MRLDLRCEGDDGTRFIVEMQQSGQRHFFKRCGPEWAGRYISEYTFREKHTGEVPDESISLRFVELDRSEYIMTVPIRAMGPLLYVE